MNLVDSSAWLSYFAGDKNATIFAKPIEKINEVIVPSIILTEVFKRIIQQRNEDLALQAIAHIQQGIVIPLDSGIALNAAHFGIEYKLPLADSIIYATARKHDATLWTQDADFQGLENVKYFSSKKS